MSSGAVFISHLVKDFRIGIRGIKLRAVDDVSFEVSNNQIFGLLGPNGCGKSTVMKLLLGLLEPTAGQCSIFGISSREVASRKAVGFLPEAPYFQKFLSGFEWVRYCGKLCGMRGLTLDKRVREVLHLVDLEAAADRRVGTYSKGMLQRVGIAQALVHDPRLLVLDEPTAGVDPIGFEVIAKLLLDLKENGKTIFICSHLLAHMEGLCNRIGIMNRGKLVIEGTVDDLLQVKQRSNLFVEGLSESAKMEMRELLAKHGGASRRSRSRAS